MLVNTIYAVQIHLVFVQILKRGLTLKFVPMSAFAKHRIEQAKERLRSKLTYEYITSIPKYKKYTKDQYEKLIASIEVLSLIFLESIINGNKF